MTADDVDDLTERLRWRGMAAESLPGRERQRSRLWLVALALVLVGLGLVILRSQPAPPYVCTRGANNPDVTICEAP